MKRAIVVLVTVIGSQALAACGTVAGGAIGGGIGATQGRTAQGVAIGAGVGMLYDLSR